MTGLEPPDTRIHPMVAPRMSRFALLLIALGALAAVALIVAVLV